MKYVIGSVAAVILFISGVVFGGKYYAKTEIKVVKETVYETKWKYKELKPEAKPIFDIDNFNRLLQCYDSPLKAESNVEGNKLNVFVWDSCKDIELSYEIGTKNNIKMYLTFGAIGVGAGILAYALIKD